MVLRRRQWEQRRSGGSPSVSCADSSLIRGSRGAVLRRCGGRTPHPSAALTPSPQGEGLGGGSAEAAVGAAAEWVSPSVSCADSSLIRGSHRVVLRRRQWGQRRSGVSPSVSCADSSLIRGSRGAVLRRRQWGQRRCGRTAYLSIDNNMQKAAVQECFCTAASFIPHGRHSAHAPSPCPAFSRRTRQNPHPDCFCRRRC